jgi:hypothetical protein
MNTVICVLKSGGIYKPLDVDKLRNQVSRHLSIPHEFICLSDVEVNCRRIALQHDWPGWWSKIELFKPDVITFKTVYLDLDMVILDDFAELFDCQHDFAMMHNFNRSGYPSSTLMFFNGKAPVDVYKKFVVNPQHWIQYHKENQDGPYIGDQAFVWDSLDRNVALLDTKQYGIKSYRKQILSAGVVPAKTKIVSFAGRYKPGNVTHDWLKAAWR